MEKKITAVCSSIVGKVRKKNEDNFYFNGRERTKENELDLKMYADYADDFDTICIFDGMGGEAKGEVASLTVARTMKNYLKKSNNFDWDEFVYIANENVLKESSNNEIVGTTLVGVHFNQDNIEICNVGDSKIFGLKNNNLIQLSVDDNEEVINKQLGINKKGALTQHLGLKDDEIEVSPHIKEFSKTEFSKILLCSDGLTDMLKKDEITKIIINNSIQDSVEILIEKVLEKGAKDNTTIIIIDLEEDVPEVEEIEEDNSIFKFFRWR